MNPAALAQRNLQLRDILKQTSFRMRKELGNFTGGTLGGTTRIKLYNVGLITRLVLQVSARVAIGTAAAVPSDKAPWNLIQSLKLTDFDNVDRVNCSGVQLFSVNSVRRRTLAGYNNEAAVQVMANPVVPTAVNADTIIQFFVEVPVAYDEQDLRGMMLAQTAVGESYLAITWASSLYTNNNDDAVYAGAATSTVALVSGQTINVRVWQDFIYPQQINAIPSLDVATVYELAGNVISTDNLAVAQEKLISLPNVRSVIGTHFTYIFNNLMDNPTVAAGAEQTYQVSRWRILANGNNILSDETTPMHLWDMRSWLNSDLRAGMYFFQFRERPIETALYGNVQIGLTPLNVDANSRVEICHESFYLKGLALPGLPQST